MAVAFLPAHAVAQATPVVEVSFGTTSWDGPSQRLQDLIDSAYGPGLINTQTDYVGARAADLDPWFWVADYFTTFLVREVAGNANRNYLGWYRETGTMPVIDGVDDGIVFDGPSSAGASAVITFSQPMTKFGFYLNPNGPLDAKNAPEPEVFFTNRLYNDPGPDGTGALHAPANGDVQALVFDISAYTKQHTWLVCFEDLDSGAMPGAFGSADTDNDYNDFVFEVTAFGATPVQPASFGAIKALYRH